MSTNTVSTINQTAEHVPRDDISIAFIALAITVIILFSILGNSVVILAVVKTHRLRKEIANMYIVNLSCTDMLMGTVVMPSSLISLIQDGWRLGEVWCDIVCACNYLLIIVSMLTLCFISIDRYVSIRWAMDYHNIVTRPRIAYSIAYTWVQGMAFAIAPWIKRWIEYDYWEVICAINWSHHEAVYYVIVAFLLCFLGPGCVLLFCYSRILGKANKMRVQPNISTRFTKEQTRFANRAIRSLLIVMVGFFICMTPFCVTKLIKVLFPNRNIVPGYVNVSASVIAFVSCGTNPLIYGIFRKDFRMAFKITLRRLFCPHRALDPNLTMTCVSR